MTAFAVRVVMWTSYTTKRARVGVFEDTGAHFFSTREANASDSLRGCQCELASRAGSLSAWSASRLEEVIGRLTMSRDGGDFDNARTQKQ